MMMCNERREFLRTGLRTVMGLSMAPAFSALLSGCESMGELAAIGSSVAASAGLITQDQAQSLTRGAKAVAKTFQDITPEQEYYIGRSIGAVIVGKYPPCRDSQVNGYVNVLGQTLAQASDRPETFNGYRFLVLDSDDINALSAPGGLIFVTRGLLRCCEHEDAAAAVLAHEIAHVQFRHGLQAIKASRITDALTVIGAESAKTFGGQNLANLTALFEDSISDITQTLINTGYSRSQEYDADAAAITIMKRVGYSPAGLTDMLEVMKGSLRPGGFDFVKTHPAPQNRIAQAGKLLTGGEPLQKPPRRQTRFEIAMRQV
ncbi:MAG: M48 family metalloprotease [Desulfobacterales bacterium]